LALRFTFAHSFKIKNLRDMEKMTNFSQKHAIYFAISTVVMIALLVVAPQFFWVALPFFCTYFVQMLGWL
jgi:uncharacterized membrane protein